MPSGRQALRSALLLAVLLTAAFAGGLGLSAYRARQAAASARDAGTLGEVWNDLHAEYDGALPPDGELMRGAIRGMLAQLGDRYTVLVDPRPNQQQQQQLSGHYGGIGARIGRDATGRTRLAPFPDGPAARAGVQQDDVLLAIDSRPVSATEPIDDVESRLQGAVSTTVTLALERDARTFDLAIVRADIPIPSVTARILREDAGTGYVAVTRFSATTGQEVHDALVQLRAQGARRLVLDLRDDSGGLLQGAVEVASQFLSAGVVLYEETHGSSDTFFPVKPGGAATDLPLVVLVNGGTASAAETVAGALQDYGRAQLVGTRTYGKGSVQLIHTLSDGSSLHVTAAHWLTPRRRAIDGTGLVPDVPVELTAEDHEAGRDPPLARALAVLDGR